MDDIFVEVDQPLNDDPSKDYLSELVGEDKKFKTAADLAKGKFHSDQHIKTLEEKLDELRKELDTRVKMEEFLTKMNESKTPPIPPQTEVIPDSQNGQGQNSDLATQLEQLLAQREAKARTETNAAKVARVLKDNFGDDAALAINNKARELEMTVSELKDLSLRNPAAFFRLVDAKETVERQSPPGVAHTTVNSTSGQNFSPVRNAAYYDRLKRENPKLYFDQKTTVAMMNDRRTLGDKFYS